MSWPTSQARGKLLLLLPSVTLHGFQISGSQRNTSIDWDGGKKIAFNMGWRASLLPSVKRIASWTYGLFEISFL